MKLSDKIIGLRKSNGMSQEDLAEKLNVSRQAISRWESGTAMPDASNILQLSKILYDVLYCNVLVQSPDVAGHEKECRGYGVKL